MFTIREIMATKHRLQEGQDLNNDGDADVYDANIMRRRTILGKRVPFRMQIVYPDQETYDYYQTHNTLIQNAVNKWESIITDATMPNSDYDLSIVTYKNTTPADEDGGMTLGFATPTDSSITPSTGYMSMNTVFLDEPGYTDDIKTLVIVHEIGHVLGIGTRWGHLVTEELTDTSRNETFSIYTGYNGVKQYRALAGNDVRGIPIEDDHGAGTAGSHFEEDEQRVIDGHVAPHMQYEAMSGLANYGSKVSKLSVAVLLDLGYGVDYSQADDYTL